MCTSIFQIGQEDGAHVLARTMDWPQLGAHPVFVPRNFAWHSVYDDKKYVNQIRHIGIRPPACQANRHVRWGQRVWPRRSKADLYQW